MTIDEYFGEWIKVINIKEMRSVLKYLYNEYKHKNITPAYKDIFKAFNKCPYDKLKIVMLGLDPYPQKGIATGILFGNSRDTPEEKLSPSLKIIKDSVINFEIPHNYIIFDPTMEDWEKQGILMINSALTTECNKTGSHTTLWRQFIADFLKNLSNRESAIIYVLFGSQAQSFEPYINSKNNFILKEKHPAYYARTNQRMPNTIFKDIDNKINKLYNEKIVWFNELN